MNSARLWYWTEDYVLFLPGGGILKLPWCWFEVNLWSSGGLTLEVSEIPTDRLPATLWEARFTPTQIVIGNWRCPQSLWAWRYQVKRWVRL